MAVNVTDCLFDCASAINRANQALSPPRPAVGHLRLVTSTENKIISSQCMLPTTLSLTLSHPERVKPQHTWTADDWGIRNCWISRRSATTRKRLPHLLLRIGRSSWNPYSSGYMAHVAGKETPSFQGCVKKCAQRYNFQRCRKKRDV